VEVAWHRLPEPEENEGHPHGKSEPEQHGEGSHVVRYSSGFLII
jgi:hypothetical protein